ncbi:cobalamin biosynthesis protein CobW, partial [Klebsiella pneumoniae]|nr:cobalamin biosynthesis protein CobW [Klebsiella pneumoniae]
MAVPWGNLQLDELLSMPDYDFHRVALLIDELQDAIDAVLTDETDKKYDISCRVIEDDRQFHPQRLWDNFNLFKGAGVYRR